MVEKVSDAEYWGIEESKPTLPSYPTAKIGPDLEELILELRGERNLGARQIQSDLKRLYGVPFSIASIHKVLCRHRPEMFETIWNQISPQQAWLTASEWEGRAIAKDRQDRIL